MKLSTEVKYNSLVDSINDYKDSLEFKIFKNPDSDTWKHKLDAVNYLLGCISILESEEPED